MKIDNQNGLPTPLRSLEKVLIRIGLNPHTTHRMLVKVIPANVGEISEFLSARTLFFILSVGRSGSDFLAGLLSTSPNAAVAHEPVPLEAVVHLEAIRDPDVAARYIRDFRRKQIYLLIQNRNEPIYGETNGNLRRHIDPIRQEWPHATLVHLVRNPKRVVSSIMNRAVLTDAHPVYKPSVLLSSILTQEEWDAMSRFEKVCHTWQEENAYIRERVKHFVRFEDLIAEYGYFKSNLLDVLGLQISEETWATMANQPVNVSTRHQFPPFEKWSRDQRDIFEHLCGPEMTHYGYTIHG